MKCGLTFTERIVIKWATHPLVTKIDNGIAVIDQPVADKLVQFLQNYLSGMSYRRSHLPPELKTYHGTAKRLMETNIHYLGDSFYPAIIDMILRQKAQENATSSHSPDEIISKHK